MSHPQVNFLQTSFDDASVLKSRRATTSKVTVKAQLQQLRETGRYDCFNLQWKPIYDDRGGWPVTRTQFWDSDVAKWIEGACYLLTEDYDAEVDAAVQEIVSMIRSAKQPDGYLNVYFTLVEPDARWSNIRDRHELYNAGHLIEAALAHRAYYKNDLLMEPLEAYVKLMHSVFGPGEDQRHAYPGHPEIELALLRLYTATNNQDAYDLAKYFIQERGNPTGQHGMLYYDWEEGQRGDHPYQRPNCYPMARNHWYNQAHAPILHQATVEGHAVRAMYLFTAVADLVVLDKIGLKPFQEASAYSDTLKTLWNNMVDKRMYLTGGIGAMSQWEGFGRDYFLPQSTDEGGCYSETCASIGVIMLAERLLHIDLDSRYADVLELQLYNAVMTAMSLEGNAFTYVNQLASSDQDGSGRATWFDCSCCPPNLMRLYGSLGGYLWDYGSDRESPFINVHLYTQATLTFKVDNHEVKLSQRSNWPWEGEVSFNLQGPTQNNITIRLRIPAWSGGKYTISPALQDAEVANGYLVLPPSYTAQNPDFTLQIHGFEPRFISPHPYTNQYTVALARGPIVYCVEDHDNPWEEHHFKDIVITKGTTIQEEKRDCQGENYVELRCKCQSRLLDVWAQKNPGVDPGAVNAEHPLSEERELIFVPYYLRANRGGRGHMRVGLLRA